MEKKESAFVIGGVAAGVAVVGSLFLLYPDLMFKNTSMQAQQNGAAPVTDGSPTTTPPESTTTAAINSTNSTAGNTTAGVPAYTPVPPGTGSPPY